MAFLLTSSVTYGFVFLCGVILGSFLNSWIWRTRENIRVIMGRSMCVACHRTLAWYENIPLFSFIFLRGRCRTCRAPIPRHYPTVEFCMGALLTIVFAYHMRLPVFRFEIFWRDIFFTTILLIIFVYDALYLIILPRIIWLGSVLGFGVNYFVLGFSLRSLLVGALIGSGVFLLQFVISKGRWIGGGDVRMGFMMGLWLGWPIVVVALFLSYVSGAIIGVLLLVFKKKTWQAQIPFGTFLALGTFTALFYGNELVTWYLHFLG